MSNRVQDDFRSKLSFNYAADPSFRRTALESLVQGRTTLCWWESEILPYSLHSSDLEGERLRQVKRRTREPVVQERGCAYEEVHVSLEMFCRSRLALGGPMGVFE